MVSWIIVQRLLHESSLPNNQLLADNLTSGGLFKLKLVVRWWTGLLMLPYIQGCVIELQQWFTQRAKLTYTQSCMQPLFFTRFHTKESFVLELKDKHFFYTFNKNWNIVIIKRFVRVYQKFVDNVLMFS